MTNDIEGKVREILEKFESSEPDINNMREEIWHNLNEKRFEVATTSILSLTTLPKDSCDVCWTSSWMTVPEGTPNAQQVTGKDEWVLCQMCEADRKIRELTNPPLSEKEVEKFLDETTGLNKHCCKEIAINLCHNFSKPVIKYPEKKDKLDFKNDDSITLGFKDGWNQAISDMRKLNGEGGV